MCPGLTSQVANTAMDEYSRARQDGDDSAKAFQKLEQEELEDEGHQVGVLSWLLV